MTAPMQGGHPVQPEYRVAIIGTGFSGMGMAIRLRQQGENSFVLLEQAKDFGGTWRDNHYPGCACDVPSHLYSFSFEQNPDWSRAFSPQPEIQAYLGSCAEKYHLQDNTRFGSRVQECRWDESRQYWVVTLANGERLTAQMLVGGFGGLSRPSWPQVDGLEQFTGETFHSQQWNDNCDLSGKRVAVIGTGASAIQIVPELQKVAASLKVFQRTAPWVLPKPDREFSKLEKTLFRRVPLLQDALRTALYWQHEWRVLPMMKAPGLMKAAGTLGRAYIRRKVADPALRAKVTPNYTMGCKRILMSNSYYPALCQDNVELVPSGLQQVRASSVVASDGSEHEVDVIVFATGFDVANPVGNLEVVGRDGANLRGQFERDGAQAYLGSAVSGFPNLFLMMGPNSGLGHNSMVFMIESQIQYVLDALRTLQRKQLRAVEIKRPVQDAYNEQLQQKFQGSIWTDGSCNSWYLDEHGRNFTLWPDFTWRFRRRTARFDVAAYHLSHDIAPSVAQPALEPALATA